MENYPSSRHERTVAADGNRAVDNRRVFTVKYGLPEDLNEEQLRVLMIMILNRVDSIVMDQSFDRNTLQIVMAEMTLPEWDDRNAMADCYYRNETLVIDEIFNDLEDDLAYRSTLGDLARCQALSFQVKQITDNRIYLFLNQ